MGIRNDSAQERFLSHFLTCATWVACIGLIAFAISSFANGATVDSPNFIVTAESESLAQAVSDVAEKSRREHAVDWFGEEMPKWWRPCEVEVRVVPGRNGGATQFLFDEGEVFGWQMSVQGDRERLLDSVVPHEVLHTVFATHYRQPLPRWCDEGACTTVEHASEKTRMAGLLGQAANQAGGVYELRLRPLFAVRDYDQISAEALYGGGWSVAEFLIDKGGRKTFARFMGDQLHSGSDRALATHYGYPNIEALEKEWHHYVAKRCLVVGPNGRCQAVIQQPARPRPRVVRPETRLTDRNRRPQSPSVPARPAPQVVRGERGLQGKQGERGPRGHPGKVTQQQLDAIVSRVVQQVSQQLPAGDDELADRVTDLETLLEGETVRVRVGPELWGRP